MTTGLLGLCLLVLASFPCAALAAVQAYLDRYAMTEGETVTLTFQTDQSGQKLVPDLTPLEEQFTVLDKRTETNFTVVNGQQSSLVKLMVSLEPKVSGRLSIPSFELGGDRTRPMTLTVEKAPDLEPGELPPVFIEVELLPGDGPYYVHAQLGLVVRIFFLPDTSEAAIGQPNPSSAAVRLLQETPFQAERGGKRYRVLERHYAVFPERSGEMTIPPMVLSGRLIERGDGASWQSRSRGRRISAASEEIVVQIQPRPDEYSGDHWLPARALEVSQQVSTTDSLRVGEPVTRTVIVEAAGLEENMLVEPAWPEMEDARIYPDQPQGITRDDGKWVLGHKEFRYAVVPEREGRLVLPELRLDWWDTQANQQRTAVLPEKVLEVMASDLVPSPVQPSSSAAIGPIESVPPPGVDTGPGFWRVSTILLAALWLLTLYWGWNRRAAVVSTETTEKGTLPFAEAACLAELKKACDSGDAVRARRAMRAWLRARGFSSRSLLEFGKNSGDEELKQALYELDSVGCRPEVDVQWNGGKMYAQLQRWISDQRVPGSAEEVTTDLYARAR